VQQMQLVPRAPQRGPSFFSFLLLPPAWARGAFAGAVSKLAVEVQEARSPQRHSPPFFFFFLSFHLTHRRPGRVEIGTIGVKMRRIEDEPFFHPLPPPPPLHP